MKLLRLVMLLVIVIAVMLVTSYGVHAYWQQRMTIAVNARSGQAVERVQEVVCDAPFGWPVVLVRDVSASSVWWVQEPCRAQRGSRFAAIAHFGNETTTPGTHFQLVVLSVRDVEQASRFVVGSTLDQLPAEIPHTEPVELIRQ